MQRNTLNSGRGELRVGVEGMGVLNSSLALIGELMRLASGATMHCFFPNEITNVLKWLFVDEAVMAEAMC